MRYYNESPQVALWKERCNRLERMVENLNEEVERRHKNFFKIAKQRDDALDELDKYESDVNSLKKELRKYKDEIHKFNSRPWYKKMFYKIKL